MSIVLMPAYTPGVLWFLRLPRTPLSVWRDLKPAVAVSLALALLWLMMLDDDGLLSP